MPYLEVYKSENEETNIIEMPNCVGMTIDEAKEILDGFDIQIQAKNYSRDDKVTMQIPDQGVKIKENGKVFLYLN